jgi:hypothetical protein
MHGLMQKGLAADAEIEGNGRQPERAAGGHVLAVGPGGRGWRQPQPEPIALQITPEGTQVWGKHRQSIGESTRWFGLGQIGLPRPKRTAGQGGAR